jgi:hypothetical protein
VYVAYSMPLENDLRLDALMQFKSDQGDDKCLEFIGQLDLPRAIAAVLQLNRFATLAHFQRGSALKSCGKFAGRGCHSLLRRRRNGTTFASLLS